MLMIKVAESGELDASFPYMGVGKTLEEAMHDLLTRFQPKRLVIKRNTVQVFKRDKRTLTYRSIANEELGVATLKLAAIYGQIQ